MKGNLLEHQKKEKGEGENKEERKLYLNIRRRRRMPKRGGEGLFHQSKYQEMNASSDMAIYKDKRK